MLSNLPKGDWSPEGRLVSRREIGLPKGDWSSRREIDLPNGDWKAWSISTNIPFGGIGIAPILSPVTAKGRVRSAD